LFADLTNPQYRKDPGTSALPTGSPATDADFFNCTLETALLWRNLEKNHLISAHAVG
jgi:hypothetical protein